MNRTLGIDLGTNSLGWAILDDITSDVIDKGVIVFPEGAADEVKSSAESQAALRRSKRMGRRIKFRRKIRKWKLLEVLRDNKMCPITEEELRAWKNRGVYPIGNRAFIEWLKATDEKNPYCDRNSAAEGKVAGEVLGRALYHICQRRGFRSSRKDEASAVDSETGKTIDKEQGKVKAGISELSEEIAKSGAKTLGQYFYRLMESERGAKNKSRIRCRYTGRNEHYEQEFDVIMSVQEIDGDLRKKLHNAIFYQRPLRSQKHLVGKCPLEKKNARAQIGHPAFEEFRMLAFVNNLSLEDEDGNWKDENGNFLYPLTEADRALICTAFEKKSANMKFAAISKLFKKDPRFKKDGLRFHYYADDESVSTCKTRSLMKLAFGDVAYDEQKVFDALMFYDDTEKLRGWFKRHYPKMGDEAVDAALKIHPVEGNANYSLKAINLMLPFLRKGFELSFARFCAKLPEVLSDYAAHEREIIEALKERQFEYRDEKRRYGELSAIIRKRTPKPAGLFERYRSTLEEFGLTEEGWNNLYLTNGETYEPQTSYRCRENGVLKTVKLDRPRLPEIRLGMIRNPIVQRSMTTLRRLVNYLGDHGKIDPDDTIRIELARTVNDFATRVGLQKWQRGREKLRDEAVVEIEKLGVKATDEAIERYLLWKEQGGVCLYTGKSISLAKLYSGNEFDVEHTIPRSLCGDDSLANKTICDATYNRQTKKGQVPSSCPKYEEIEVRLSAWKKLRDDLEKNYRNQVRRARGVTDPAAHSAARAKAVEIRQELNYWRDKLRRFEVSIEKLQVGESEFGGFKKRQLVDAGIMSSHAVELLKSVYCQTYAVNGTATAFARKAWGLQGDAAKDRSEHTHHAVDAMVIAALKPSRFMAICAALKDDGMERRRECEVCEAPCDGFAEKVRKAAQEILVKHVQRQTTLRQSSKRNVLAKSHPSSKEPGKIVSKVLSRGDTIRGQMHNDTFYGCIKSPEDGEIKYVVRKSLVGALKDVAALVDKIVDPEIRKTVENAVDELKARGVGTVEPGMIKMASGVPINKVRIFAKTTNPLKLRKQTMPSKQEYKSAYYVTAAPGSNFRLALFSTAGKQWVEPDNSLVWAQDHKKADYQPLDQKDGFIGYVRPGSMALAATEEEIKTLAAHELGKRLYKIVKFDSTGLMTFKRHTEARASVVLKDYLKSVGKHAAGESKIDVNSPHELLLLSPATYMKAMMFEGIDFTMQLDGTIRFLR